MAERIEALHHLADRDPDKYNQRIRGFIEGLLSSPETNRSGVEFLPVLHRIDSGDALHHAYDVLNGDTDTAAHDIAARVILDDVHGGLCEMETEAATERFRQRRFEYLYDRRDRVSPEFLAEMRETYPEMDAVFTGLETLDA